MEIITHSERETEDAGAAFAAGIPDGTVVAMYGELGAGKTAFVRGMALKRRDKSATDVDSRRAILVSELHGSLWSMSRRMRNAGKYGAYPNAILQLMYLLDILGDTIDR